ncbi:SRPBCC family protein [Desertivirga xinjiangensis]|uniref:SRPBCC family protein n=1 Tax=Desertivirga xinjiangensis TaxID=539206 RepID=UPI00210D8E69|nr:SRPBCC family protein [Pedobacter xinjiangensis]
METKPLVVEDIYNAPIEKVWKALTDKDQMKEWYFDISGFKPEKGFKFSFTGGDENVQYLHECEVLHVEAPNKLSYTWTYPEYDRRSVLTVELFEEAERQTRLRLSHEGLGSFQTDDPNFSVSSFTGGWNFILGESLKNYVETGVIQKSVVISASAENIWDVLLHPEDQWGKAFGGGASVETDWKPGSEVRWLDSEGNVGSVGKVKEHRNFEYLQVDMYDDVEPAPGSETGEYAEKYSLSKNSDGSYTLAVESGPLAKKYIEGHTAMWDEGIKLIKEFSESK